MADQRPQDQRPPEQRPPEQRPPEQRPPEQRPPEQRPPEQRPPEQSAGQSSAESVGTTPQPAAEPAQRGQARGVAQPGKARGVAWPGKARTRPAASSGPEVSGPAVADIQTTSGVPATPIPESAATPPPVPVVQPPVVSGYADIGPPAAPIRTTPEPGSERRRKPRGGPYDLGHAPAVLLLSSLGVLLVAGAYAGGRAGTGGSIAAYWIGQFVIFTPVVTRLLSRRLAGVAESFLLVIGLAVNQYLLKWMYSPEQFRFPDELQHWLATTIVVQTGALFQPNPALPPATHFPGLAEMGAATASMTGLPVTASGIIVAGVAHLVFVGVLFAAVLRASNSPAVAGVACATYATALHYLFFNSMFLYQTAALPFFMLAIWATRRWREEGGRPFVFLAIVSIGVTTVSHHVTAFALVATMLLLGVTELVRERPRRWSALAMPAATLVLVLGWMLLVAPDVIAYLRAPMQRIGQSLSELVTGGTAASVAPTIAYGQLALQGAGLTGLFVLYLAVGRDMVARRDRDTWRWAALVGGAVFFAGNAVRFLGSNGPEAAGRLATFTYVPISIIAAIALVRAVQIIPSRDAEGRRWWVQPALEVPPPAGRRLVFRVAAGSALVTLLMVGARTGGWPPPASLVPGPYLASAFERSVDAYGVEAALWEHATLGPGNRVGGDLTSVSLASTYGRQDPVREVGALYYAQQWGPSDDAIAANLRLQYLVVDRRLSIYLPLSGAYFEDDPQTGRITTPLNTAQIGKFDALTGVDRLYDNGNVRIYRMGSR